MTRRQLKRLAAAEAVTARLVSDGCRDYVIEIVRGDSAGLLRKRSGTVITTRSLGEAYDLLRHCHVNDVVLWQRVAHDEATSGVSSGAAQFTELPLRLTV